MKTKTTTKTTKTVKTSKSSKNSKPITKITPAHRQLINQAYDLLIKSFNPKSKWYNQDCEDLWNHLQTQSIENLKLKIARKKAIDNITDEQCARELCFDGLFSKTGGLM